MLASQSVPPTMVGRRMPLLMAVIAWVKTASAELLSSRFTSGDEDAHDSNLHSRWWNRLRRWLTQMTSKAASLARALVGSLARLPTLLFLTSLILMASEGA